MTQPTFSLPYGGRFQFAQDETLLPRDSHVVEPAEITRLAGQNQIILARLRRGPCTNRELSSLSLKYTSRVSDLRAAGYTVTAKRHPKGLTVYSLEADQ